MPRSILPIALLLTFILQGCIPVDNTPNTTVVQPVNMHGDSTAEEVALPTNGDNDDNAAQFGATMGENAIANIQIQIQPQENGDFQLVGSLGLNATLHFEEDLWNLEGTVTFPTTGFALGEPYLLPLESRYFGGATEETHKPEEDSEDSRPLALLNIPVIWPNAESAREPNTQTTPLRGRFILEEDYRFVATFITQIQAKTIQPEVGA